MLILVKVIPKSKQNLIQELSLESLPPNQNPRIKKYFKIKTTTAPEKGKANNSIISMLAKYFNIAKSAIIITSGQTSSLKQIEIKSRV